MDSGPSGESDRSAGGADGSGARAGVVDDGPVPLDVVPLPYQILDGEGRLCAVNDAWLDLLGYDEDEVVGTQFRSLLVERSQSPFEGSLSRCDLDGEYTLSRADDSTVVVSLDGNAVGDGDEIRVHCQLDEITDHRQREDRLERLERAVEASGHAIYLTDATGEIEYVNPAFEEVTGYTASEAIGSTPRILRSGEMSDDYYESLWETIRAGEEWTEEITNRRKDGTLYHAHQTIDPVTEAGDVTGFVAVQADITEQKRRQEELAASRERLRVLFEESPDAITVHDEDGTIVEVNQRSVESLGYSREELLSMSIADIEVGHDETELLSFWEDAEFETNHTVEGVHRRKDGTEFPVEVWIRKVELDGETQFIALSRDISDQKRRERELERKGFLFERVQEIADIGIWEYRPDDDNLWWSEGIYDIHGVDESFDLTLENAIEFYHPEDKEEIRQALSRTIDSGERYDKDLRIQRDGGETRHVRARGEMTETDDGRELVRGVFQDVTERKEREQRLERYERLVENLPLGVYRNTPGEGGTFTLVNEGMVEMFDADSKEHLRDQPVRSLYVDPDERKQFSETLLSEGVVRNQELELETLAGDRLWANVTAIPSTADGDIVFDGVVQDITERKAYEQQLKEQRDNLDILNQVLRHDVRNDLQLVLSYVELLADHVEEDGSEYLETVSESANHAIELTRTARDLAEVMRQSDVENEPVSLSTTIEQVLEQIRSAYPDAAVRVDGSIPQVAVVGNKMLPSVFRNLVKNGIQHNDTDSPEVTISATVRDEEDIVEVRVADNGPGIPDPQKEAVFGKGEKGLESEGTGVGLYLVQELVDSYGGEVRIADNEPTGTVFVVQLQVTSADGPVWAAE
jgi:PAS domain S-box-containing protein